MDINADTAWVDELLDLTVRWLLGVFKPDNARTTYATTLGVPRERQIWRITRPRARRWP